MNFLNDNDLSPAQAGYSLSTAESVLNDPDPGIKEISDEINTEHEKVNDEMFDNEGIPEFDNEIYSEEPSPEEKRTRLTASLFVVETADELLTKAFAAYAKIQDSEKLKGSPQQLKKIAGYFSVYFSHDNFDIPNWMMGSIAAGILLFDKYKMASEIRKTNIALEQERAKTSDLESDKKKLQLEIEVLKSERERDRLKDELSNLQTKN